MKYLTILLISSIAILTSCQTSAKNFETDLTDKSLLILPTPQSKETFDIHSKIGIVDIRSSQPSCLRTKNGNLTKDTPVSIIISLDEPPQKVLTATVEKKLEKSCARRASETGDRNPGENYFYSLKDLDKNTVEEIGFDVGIAVIQPAKPIQVADKLASIDLNEDGKPEFFRRCGGFEGTHFTIWTGKPLKGRRIWHSYYYVDYDTVPTCKKKDWEDTEN